MIYTVLLIIIAVIAYGIGSMSSVVIASNYVFHVNLRRLGTGSSALSNFRRIYGAKGFVKLLLVELVRDILPILIGGHKGSDRRGARVCGLLPCDGADVSAVL